MKTTSSRMEDLSYEDWFAREVEADLEETRDNNLASDQEVLSRFQKWGERVTD